MRRLLLAIVFGIFATPAAYAQQSFNMYIGGFVPRAEDARTPNDVLVNDLALEGLAFNIEDFKGATVGGDRSVLRRGGTDGRVLGKRSEAVGHRCGRADCRRGRRSSQRHGWVAVHVARRSCRCDQCAHS